MLCSSTAVACQGFSGNIYRGRWVLRTQLVVFCPIFHAHHAKRSALWYSRKEKCDEDCNRPVQDRIRHLSSDVGFYLKWEVDANGYPTEKYCDAFGPQKNSVLGNRDWMWLYHFDSSKTSAFEKDKNDPKKISKDRQRILDGGEEGRTANCPKQV